MTYAQFGFHQCGVFDSSGGQMKVFPKARQHYGSRTQQWILHNRARESFDFAVLEVTGHIACIIMYKIRYFFILIFSVFVKKHFRRSCYSNSASQITGLSH
jgi:hypothetical protein